MAKFCYLISFILYSTLKSATLKDNDKISLIYYEYSYNLSEINLVINNTDVNIIDTLSCYLAFIKNEDSDIKEIFDFYSSYFNRQWIFFTNNSEIINNLLKIDYNSYDIDLFGIIIPANLTYKIEKEYDIPIFEINNNYIKYIEKWDIRNEKKNIFFSLKIYRELEYYPENYFLLLSIFVFILNFFILLYWKIMLKKINPIYILNLHKIGNYLIYLNNILCFILIINSINIRGKKIYSNEEESSILLDTVLITLISIHRTILWLFALLVSYGWNITLQQLSPRDCKFFLIMILVIFFALSSDSIIDSVFNPIYRMNISEIKNSIFYLVFIYIMLYKIDKNKNILKLKIEYVELISPQYISSLLFKVNIFMKLEYLLIFYYLIFLVVFVFHKTIFFKYDEVILELYDYFTLDCLFEYLILIIFRPKVLPDNYNMDLGDYLEAENGNIYNCYLPKFSETQLKIKDLTKKQVEECIKKKIPILIVGPNINNIINDDNIENINENTNNNINKYFLNLNIGFT